MSRATWALAATTIVAVAASVWLWVDNRSLRARLVDRPQASGFRLQAEDQKDTKTDPWTQARPAGSFMRGATVTPPSLPAQNEESRMERRTRRQQEIAAMFGRGDGETEDEYRARIVPLIKTGLAIPRSRAEDMRKVAETQAHVTPEQSQKLDHAFDKVYGDVLDYTNKAIADGQLSPYERNVAGWLEYAGGLGAMLGEAQGQIGQILSPDQMKAMYDSGFEWGEYLGLEAPWEKLTPPPPPKH